MHIRTLFSALSKFVFSYIRVKTSSAVITFKDHLLFRISLSLLVLILFTPHSSFGQDMPPDHPPEINHNESTSIPNDMPNDIPGEPSGPPGEDSASNSLVDKVSNFLDDEDDEDEEPQKDFLMEAIFNHYSVKSEQLFATLKTNKGDIKIKLFGKYSEKTVQNFVELALGKKPFKNVEGKKVQKPFYNGLKFHKIMPGFIVQTGCPFGNGKGGPGFTIKDESSEYLDFTEPGMVAMAKYKKDTAGSQFFITLKPRPELNGKFTIFGKVIEGLPVVSNISRSPASVLARPIKEIIINEVIIKDEGAKSRIRFNEGPGPQKALPVPAVESRAPSSEQVKIDKDLKKQKGENSPGVNTGTNTGANSGNSSPTLGNTSQQNQADNNNNSPPPGAPPVGSQPNNDSLSTQPLNSNY